MRSRVRTIGFLVAVVSALSASAQRPPLSKRPAAAVEKLLQAEMEHIRNRDGFPGATLAFILPDGTSGATAVGFADLERERLMQASDRMLAGSVGKTFVSATLLQLIDENKVRLDDKLSAWLGANTWFGRLPNASDLTIRMLLNHTSGIPDHVYVPEFAAAVRKNPARAWRPEEMVAYVLDKPPLFPAGKGWSYADTNYILVGMVIERATHDLLYRQIESRFLKPLHLTHTAPSDHPRLKGLVPGYADLTVSWGQHRKVAANGRYDFNPQSEWAGGGLISNSADLARWTKTLYGNHFLLSANAFAELTNGVDTPRGYKYGLGVYVRQTPLGPAYGHAGEIPGYFTITSFWPGKGLTIALQFNTDDATLFKESGPSNIFLPKLIDQLAQTVVDFTDRH